MMSGHVSVRAQREAKSSQGSLSYVQQFFRIDTYKSLFLFTQQLVLV